MSEQRVPGILAWRVSKFAESSGDSGLDKGIWHDYATESGHIGLLIAEGCEIEYAYSGPA